MAKININSNGIAQWVSFDAEPVDIAAITVRCTPELLTRAIGHLGELDVVSASVNTSGQYTVPPPPFQLPMPLPNPLIVGDLPPFCEVIVNARGSGNHVATITVWVPLNWNERFLATLGGGNRTDSFSGQPEFIRSLTMPTALRNGFATATTDGANKSNRFDWGVNPETRKFELELTENWIHRSTHEMTLIAKAVTEAIHGRAPKYSYAAGCSGGGRQALVEAQRYPDDYDGIWSSDPAINWTRFIPASLWPALVMKEIAVLPVAKLRAFREAAIAACDGIDGLCDGIVGGFDACDFDARRIVGQATEAGEITERDAEAMNLIWEGPRTRDGRFFWHGLGAGNESWGDNTLLQGTCMIREIDGIFRPEPWDLAIAYVRGWLVKDLDWDWKTLTFDSFEQLCDQSVQEMVIAASDDPDLSGLLESGGKVMITHGAWDFVIPHMGSVDYYRRVIEAIGGEEETRAFVRLFISEGDGHGVCRNPGPGVTIADAMATLMKWVEHGEAPDEVLGRTLDPATQETLATRPVYAYPYVPHYRGVGDAKEAESFRPVHFATRAELSKQSMREQDI